jgi:hypothetical protein
MVCQDGTRSSPLAAAAIAVALCLSGCSAVADHPRVSNGRRNPGITSAKADPCPAAPTRRPKQEVRRWEPTAKAGVGPEVNGQARGLELMPVGTAGTARPDASQRKVAPGETEHLSPDGQWVAIESGRGASRTLTVGRRDTGERRRLSGGHPAARPSWAPDSRRLVFSAREFKDPDLWVVWVFDVASGQTTRIGSANGTQPPTVAWFPDGERVCYGNDDQLVVANTATRQASVLAIPGRGRAVGTPAVSPDGRRVVFAVAGDGAWIASVEDGRFVRLVADADVDALAWAPGGREVALRTASNGRWQVKAIRQ